MILSFPHVLNILASPDSLKPLFLQAKEQLTDGQHTYPIWGGKPIVLPRALLKYHSDRGLNIPYDLRSSSEYQYFLMSQIKATSGANNDPPDDPWNLMHLKWSRELLHDAHGLVLDIGCDDPRLSASLLPGGTQYVGLDPMYHDHEVFAVVGMGEFLPFLDGSFDCALFLTSLDHIFDWHQSLDEAYRVIKPGGALYLSSLIWEFNAGLVRDIVHFQHFREYELLAGLSSAGFTLDVPRYFPWKDNCHRKVIQVKATKVIK